MTAAEQTAHTGGGESGTVADDHLYEPPDDDNEYEDDEDGWLDEECGLGADGQCAMAGTEHCDWTCPYRDSEDFAGSKAWHEKHKAAPRRSR